MILKRLVKGLLWFIGGSILTLVVLVIIAAGVIKLYPRGTLSSHWLGRDITGQYTIQNVDWLDLSARIDLKNLLIVDSKTRQVLIKTQQLTATILGWKSLASGTIVTQTLNADGVSLSVKPSHVGKAHAGLGLIFWHWLKLQQQIRIQHATIDWQFMTPVGKRVIQWTHAFLSWQSQSEFKHNLAMSARLPEAGAGKFDMRAIVTNRPEQLRSAILYVHLKGKKLAQLLRGIDYHGLKWQRGGGNLNVWSTWSQDHLHSVRANFALQHIKLANSVTHAELQLPYLAANVLWQKVLKGDWHLSVQPLLLKPLKPGHSGVNDYFSLSENQLDTHQRHSTQVVKASLSEINLNLLSHAFLLWPDWPNDLFKVVSALHVQGQASQVVIDTDWLDKKLKRYTIQGKLNNFSTDAYRAWPSLRHINADIQASSQGGEIKLNSPDFIMGASRYAYVPWPPLHLKAELTWQPVSAEHWRIRLQHFSLVNPQFNVYLTGVMALHKPWAESHIVLTGSSDITHAEPLINQYLATPYIPASTYKWLQNEIVKTGVIHSQLLVSGILKDWPFLSYQGVSKIVMHVKGASIRPAPQWPVVHQVNGTVEFIGRRFNATVSSGKALGVRVNDIKMSIADMRQSNGPLNMAINTTADGSAVHAFWAQSPLKQNIPYLADLSTAGNTKVQVGLGIYFTDPTLVKSKGSITFINNTLNIHHFAIPINRLNGVIHFNEGALSSRSPLTANFMGKPLSITIEHRVNNQLLNNIFNFKGEISSQYLYQKDAGLKQIVSGETVLQAQLKQNKKTTTLSVNSSLKGLSILLPKPFEKNAQALLPLRMDINFGSNNDPIKFELGNWIAGRLWVLDQTYATLVGNVRLGTHQSSLLQTSAKKIPTTLTVSGTLKQVSIDAWANKVKGAMTHHHITAAPVNQNGLFSKLNLNIFIQQLFLLNQDMGSTDIHLGKDITDNWMLGMIGPQMTGEIIFPQSRHAPLQVTFQKIILDNLKLTNHKVPIDPEPLAQLPAVTMQVAHLQVNHVNYGAVSLQTKPIVKGIQINDLIIHSPLAKAEISGAWAERRNEPWVSLSGEVISQNWGDLLAAYGYSGILSQTSGSISTSLSWAGGLRHIQTRTLNGQLLMNFANGNILKVNPGVAKVLGLLSVSTLLQRLHNNPKGLAESGLNFSTIVGNYVFSNGIANTKKLSILGPSMDLLIHGSVNFNQKTLNQVIVLVPHVSGGIALAATLLGGPIAGVATLVADKVIGNTLLKDQGLVYRLTGSWDNPKFTAYDQQDR